MLGLIAGDSAQASAPPCRYTVTNNLSGAGVVRGGVTGLTWQQTMTSTTYSWTQAQSYCSSLTYGGFSSGWRLPALKELVSIVDYTQMAPSIDGDYFYSTPGTGSWANTPFSVTSGEACYVLFTDGTLSHDLEGTSLQARCVR